MKITRWCRTALRLVNLAVVIVRVRDADWRARTRVYGAEFVRMRTDDLARLHPVESSAERRPVRTAFGACGFSDS